MVLYILPWSQVPIPSCYVGTNILLIMAGLTCYPGTYTTEVTDMGS